MIKNIKAKNKRCQSSASPLFTAVLIYMVSIALGSVLSIGIILEDSFTVHLLPKVRNNGISGCFRDALLLYVTLGLFEVREGNFVSGVKKKTSVMGKKM